MRKYIAQYKALFYFTWVMMYFVFPVWRFPNNHGDQFAINGFIVYFAISAYIVNRYFNLLIINKPLFIKSNNLSKCVKDNLWLVILCVVSLFLHIYFNYFTSVIAMGEVIFLRQSFWIYDFLDIRWHSVFDFPVQYAFWFLMSLMIILIKQKKAIDFISDHIKSGCSNYKTSKLSTLLLILIIIGMFNLYSFLFPYYSSQESIDVLRYPPVSRYIYLIIYSAFGISELGPRIVQFIFYIAGSVYLYRTILLFSKKEAALLGVTIYLFSPIVFFHATLASAGSGVVCFVTLISYYFLRFIKEENNRDLLLSTFFIGLGFLYKEEIVLMFVICFTYLVFCRMKSRNWGSLLHFKILTLSLIPVLPWLKIGPGNFQAAWRHFISIEGMTTYFQMLQNQLSLIIFSLFIVSLIVVLIRKRNDLSLFFGLFFLAYYGFFTLKEAGAVHRYSLVLYPAIHVFLAQFICNIIQRIRWKHGFKLVYSVITIYLIVICLIPRSSSGLVTYNYSDFEYQRYPIDKAAEWVRTMTDEKDKVLALYFVSDIRMYMDRIYEHRDEIKNRIIFYVFAASDVITSSEDLKQYCYANNISYVMLPYSPKKTLQKFSKLQEREEMMNSLKENIGKDFKEVAKFSFDDNFILVYKPKGNNPKLQEDGRISH